MHTNYTNKETKLIHPKLSYTITGICFEVHNELGRYAREKQYRDVLEQKFIQKQIKYKKELPLQDSGNIIDFLIDDKIILELKAKPLILKADYYQVQRYLQASDIKLALLINFRNRYLKPVRIVRIETKMRDRFL